MPRVSAFYGIEIRMYYNEDRHTGRPHFHAILADDEASFDIETLKPLGGSLPGRGTRMVIRWAATHRRELRLNWQLARRRQPLLPIEGLR